MRLSNETTGRLLALPAASYMLLFFVAPTAVLMTYSFWRAASYQIIPDFVLSNYVNALTSALFWRVTGNAVTIGLITAAATLLLAIPVAYYLTYVRKSQAILYLVLITWFSSYLVRVYAWRTLLGTSGVLNTVLLQLGLVDAPVEAFLFSRFAVAITLIHVYLPLSILLVASSLRDIKPELVEASRDLGTSQLGAFFRVVAPNAANGLIGAFMLTFILVAGDYVTPQMLGGASGQTTGLLIADQFRKTGNWPLGAAQAFIMFAISILLYGAIVVAARWGGLLPMQRRRKGSDA